MSDISAIKVNLEKQALGELLSSESKSGVADKVTLESQARDSSSSDDSSSSGDSRSSSSGGSGTSGRLESKGGTADVVGALSLNESKAGA